VETVRNCRKVALALATLITAVLLAPNATSSAQGGQRVVNLSPGCNMTTLTFPTGTQSSALGSAVSPLSALQAVWRLDNTSRSFQAFMPQAPQASDLTSLNLLDAAFICVDAAATISMPTVAADPAGTPISASLSTGCNAIGLTFPDSTPPSQAAAAVTPADAFQALWRLDNATGSFQAYVAAAPQASDLASLRFLDAAFVCTSEPASLAMPTVMAPAGGAAGGPPLDVKYVMEGAVPQVVDLPEGFVAVDESFNTSDAPGTPPGGLYSYSIFYGSTEAITSLSLETPFVAMFQLALFDTVDHAKSFMKETTSVSAEQMKEDIAPVFGGSLGMELESLDIEQVEPLATIGEEANFIRVRMYVRPVGSNEVMLPLITDMFTIRRDRVIGQVSLIWTPGPPGPDFIPQNLGKRMDTGIQQALPELLTVTK
jgi:hypothetical protein